MYLTNHVYKVDFTGDELTLGRLQAGLHELECRGDLAHRFTEYDHYFGKE